MTIDPNLKLLLETLNEEELIRVGYRLARKSDDHNHLLLLLVSEELKARK